MYLNMILVFLFLHVIADYYLQTQKMADASSHLFFADSQEYKAKRYFIIHLIIYAVIMLLGYLYVSEINVMIMACVFIVTHAIIDIIKHYINYKTNNKYKQYTFIFDQLLHITIIVAAALISIGNYENHIEINSYIRWAVAIIFVLKPANVIFKNIFLKYKPENEEPEDSTKNAGSLIGDMERILSVICFATGQYIALGFIVTCKGFARHANIVKNQKFAEYFLIGTFYSLLYSFFIYYVVFVLLVK